EVHLDLDQPVALARLAAAALDVEAEAAGLVAARLRLGQAGEPVADLGEGAGVGRRVRARGAADRRLIDLDHLVAVFEAGEAVVRAGDDAGAVERAGGRGVERVDHEAGLARARDTGDAAEGAEREAGGDVLEVVGAGAFDRDRVAVARAALGRNLDLARAGEIGGGEAVAALQHGLERAFGDDPAAVDAGAGAEIDHPVGGADRVLVVLDDDHGVAEVARALER